MSLAVGAVSSSNNNNMGGYDEEDAEKSGDEHMKRSGSEASLSATDQEEEDDATIQLGPQYTLKEQLEKDKVCLLCVVCVCVMVNNLYMLLSHMIVYYFLGLCFFG